ncbi:MAG: cell division protein FtsQ/DivIB [Bacteroidia bacterium]|nr:cell division protein FtsQ/DivIB [Bacteroidia bacterium]
MRVNWNYIKAISLLALVVFLYAFSSQKSMERNLTGLTVNFIGDENLYITRQTVNKLLIQNEEGVTSVPKDILDLNELESTLNSNPMIKSAEVYVTVNGEVKAEVEQRKPIARVSTNASFYIDDEGYYMPLSSNHSARVPLVTGFIDKNKLENVFKIADRVYNDVFLKKHIIEIHQDKNESIHLKTRVFDFEIILGHLDNLDQKINNLKAFYQKAKKDNTFNNYSKVNLKFNNQVVCTKK